MQARKIERSGNIVDIIGERIFRGTVVVEKGRIRDVQEKPVNGSQYILPGLIDAHIHIESSMLVPSEFARLAVIQGTVATVSDPHEIANVLGIDGIRYMISNGKQVPFKFCFGASSCVPATSFETSGARLGADEIEELFKSGDVNYLSEMMNFPGVLSGDPTVMAKLVLARKYNMPVDGHAPGLTGKDLEKYISAGISTDHECFTINEALEKIGLGMHILIREGSAARNFDALAGLLDKYPDRVMFCSDDRHPDDLAKRHMNDLVKRAIAMGFDPLIVLRCCILNPIRHYRLDVGMLRKGDPADFIVIDDLRQFNVLETYINGIIVAEKGRSLIHSVKSEKPNKFNTKALNQGDIRIAPESRRIRLIEALEGQLITHNLTQAALIEKNNVISDPSNDILKMVVMNRYKPAPPAIAFVRGFGLTQGAIASTVAHDSHNIIAVGVADHEIIEAINLLIGTGGGISCTAGGTSRVLPLPVAGLMSDQDGFEVASSYEAIDRMAKSLGTSLRAPFMTLSFMALLVIPELKLSDKGLFDGRTFGFTSLFVI
jgi:adenine deaminase